MVVAKGVVRYLGLDFRRQVSELEDESIRNHEGVEGCSHALLLRLWFPTLLAIYNGGLHVVGIGFELSCNMFHRILLEWELDHDPAGFMINCDGIINDVLLVGLSDGDGSLLRTEDAFCAIRTVRTPIVQHRIVIRILPTHPGVLGERSPGSVEDDTIRWILSMLTLPPRKDF